MYSRSAFPRFLSHPLAQFRWTSLPPTTAEQVVRRPPATLDLAGSWQLNKAWLLKGSVSSSGLAALGAHVRSWSSLGISLGASIVADLRTRATQCVQLCYFLCTRPWLAPSWPLWTSNIFVPPFVWPPVA